MVKSFCVIMPIILLFFIGCDREQQESSVIEETQTKMRTIVALGDSLTAGFSVADSESYPARLEQKLQEEGYDYRVVNAGVSGETSSGTLSRMEWILTLKPDIVLLETGANDGLRGIDTDLIENNIRDIMTLLKNRDVVVLLAGMKMVWNLGPMYVKRFNGIYPKLAEEFDAVFLPFFLDGVAMRQDLNLSDGLHPNAQGYKVVADNIYPYVVEAINKRED